MTSAHSGDGSRRPSRGLLPIGASLLVHAVALAYLPSYGDPEGGAPDPLEVSLRPPPPSPPEPVRPPAAEEAPSQVPARRSVPRRRTHGEASADPVAPQPSPGAATGVDGDGISVPRAAVEDQPPAPFRLFPRPAGDPAALARSRDDPALSGQVRPPGERRAVEPFTGSMDARKAPGYPEGAGPITTPNVGSGSGPSVGGSFDFWAPPDFHEEMARAKDAIAAREKTLEGQGTKDLGHGVICNTDGLWFVCGPGGIEECNARHDGMCRYAKATERAELERAIIF